MNITAQQELQRKKQKRLPLPHWSNQEAVVEISLLTNDFMYGLQCVFIIQEKNSFRLVVIHNNRLLDDRRYKTSQGAKAGFERFYKEQRWNVNVKAYWTPFYNPDSGLLEEKMEQPRANLILRRKPSGRTGKFIFNKEYGDEII